MIKKNVYVYIYCNYRSKYVVESCIYMCRHKTVENLDFCTQYTEVALPFFQWSGPGSGYVATPLNLHYIINHFCNNYVHNILKFTACVVRL